MMKTFFGKIHCTACAITVFVTSPRGSCLNVSCPKCGRCLLQGKVAEGYVYILENDLMPGIIKIGMTDRDPFQRAAELSSATGVPAPYVVKAYFFADHPQQVEAILHATFDKHRFNSKREFFRVPLTSVVSFVYKQGACVVKEGAF